MCMRKCVKIKSGPLINKGVDFFDLIVNICSCHSWLKTLGPNRSLLTISIYPEFQTKVFLSPTWRCQGLNLGPSAYKAGALPLNCGPSLVLARNLFYS